VDECEPLVPGCSLGPEEAHREPHRARVPGWAVQVDPIKPTLKAPGTKRLRLKYEEPLSKVAFSFNLRRFNLERDRGNAQVYNYLA
jgi:hypothetical protein